MTELKTDLTNPIALRAYLQNKEKFLQAAITEMRKYSEAIIKFSPHWDWMDDTQRDTLLAENQHFAVKAGAVLEIVRNKLKKLAPVVEKEQELFEQQERKVNIQRLAATLLAAGMTSTAFNAARAKEMTRGVATHELIDQYSAEIKAEMKAQYKK